MPEGRILVVDDEESVSVTMQAILQMDGYRVSATTRGAEALDLLQDNVFDVVLTDLRLEDMDGLAILAEIRRRSPDTVAVMLTGYASLESAVQALREGAYDYLIKPCDVDELRATVARGMERRQLVLQLRARLREVEAANLTIRELNLDLQQRVDEATAELQRRMIELARANEEIAALYRGAQEHVAELKKLDDLKSRFLSMASHELKTPLTAVSGLSQVLVRRVQRRLETGPPEPAEWLDEQRALLQRLGMLDQQARKLGRLVDELLDVSRIESGRVQLEVALVDLPGLASDVVERMQFTTSSHELRLDVGVSAPGLALGDRDRLEQVLNNLISNGIKYSPQGGPVEVAVFESGADLVVSVHDSGVGIPKGELDAIFDLFYRAPAADHEQVQGMGLGLYICKEIVTRHGGRIWAESEPGEGSTFYFSLPRAPAGTAALAGRSS